MRINSDLIFKKKINTYLFKYQSLFYIAMLPFLALISRRVFINKKQFNLSEHFVINIYAYSQLSIIINTIYIVLLWNSKLLYYASMGNPIFQLGFFTWVFYNIFNLTLKQTLIKLFFPFDTRGRIFCIHGSRWNIPSFFHRYLLKSGNAVNKVRRTPRPKTALRINCCSNRLF